MADHDEDGIDAPLADLWNYDLHHRALPEMHMHVGRGGQLKAVEFTEVHGGEAFANDAWNGGRALYYEMSSSTRPKDVSQRTRRYESTCY